MSINQTNNFPTYNDKTKHKVHPKLILVGGDETQFKVIKKIAKDNNFEYLTYSNIEWATLEEIDQYIQDEDLSKQVIDLPKGKQAISSLDRLEEDVLKQIVKNLNRNILKAIDTFKTARAVLYKKTEKYSLNLKKHREEEFKKQHKQFKKSA